MARRRSARLLLIPALTVAAALGHAATADAVQQLPDLMEEVPYAIGIYTGSSDAGTQYQLVFGSGARNVGDGPLRIDGSRPDTSQATMAARQTVTNSDGTTTVYPNVGTLQFVDSTTHNHWHLLGFERYELRRPSDYALVSPDHKTGFCLTDSYRDPDGPPPGAPARPFYTGNCSPGQPNALSVSEGISTGYGDAYVAQKEGQYVDVTGVAAGQYYLVHRANPDRKVVEKRYDNNDATLLIQLDWPPDNAGAPTVTELKRCYGQSCPASTAPPAVVTGTASSLTQAGAQLAGTVNPNGVDGSYHFEYGTGSSYGQSTEEAVIDPTLNAQAAAAALTGLSAGTTYHYRLVGTNRAGTVNGSDHTFTTAPPAPAASTGAATVSGTTSASLAGTVSPNGGATSWFFQYGTTSGYGLVTPMRDAGSAAGEREVSEPLSGLAAGATYHYRLAATSQAGTGYGEDRSFTTAAAVAGPPADELDDPAAEPITEPPPGHPEPAPAPAPPNAFSVRELRVLSNGGALLRLDLPAAGRVSVAAVARLGRRGKLTPVGSWVRTGGPGILSLRLVPSKRALADMRRRRRGLRVSLKVGYAPTGGSLRVIRLRTSLRRTHR